MNVNDARKAHKLLDYVSQGRAILDDELKLLRSFLPELPKQKTLEEIVEHVRGAWAGASGNDCAGDSFNSRVYLEDWLRELHEQLKGLKDAPVDVPELPAGIRLADHEVFGRVVVSPATDWDGKRMIFCLDNTSREGAGRRWAHASSLTFIDSGRAKFAHPEFLETEADYKKALEGSIVALDNTGTVWLKEFGAWTSTDGDHGVQCIGLSDGRRRVLRWGWGE